MKMQPIELIKKFQDYFESLSISHTEIISKGKFEVDYKDLCQYDTEIVNEMFENADETLKAGEQSLKQIYETEVKLRIKHYGEYPSNIIKIREIRSSLLGKLKVIKGMIKQASKVIPLVVSSKFECPMCGNILNVIHTSNIIKTPERCGCGRRGKFIKLDEEKKDSQRIVLQEDIETLEGTQLPGEIGIILQDDLTNPNIDVIISQGNRVAITGIIKDIPKFTSKGESAERDFMMIANYIEPLEEQFKEIKITQEEIREIKELSQNTELKKLMIKSYCPEIYGEDVIKLGIILQLFGARAIYRDGRKIKSGNFHILLIGDPSKGKSTLAKYSSLLAPKYQYASGKGATGRGLTAYIIKDEFLGTWGVQAGAVVLASGGLAVIDEIDKMDVEEQEHLSQSMSEQQIKINKAGINTTLKAETSHLFCANFKDGRFNQYLDVFSQISFPIWMINRFALIFVMKDEPEEKRDERVFETILGKYKNTDEVKSEINTPLLKKYIIYARQNIFPELTADAEIEIKKIYIGLRRKIVRMADEKYKTIPINERQLENLIMISEASARMRLSDKVTKDDVEIASEVLFSSLQQVAFDVEKGTFDIEIVETGISTKTMNVAQGILQIIKELEEIYQKSIPIDEIFKIGKDKGYDEFKMEEVIAKLKRAGDIYEPKNGFIQRL